MDDVEKIFLVVKYLLITFVILKSFEIAWVLIKRWLDSILKEEKDNKEAKG